jgi:salicylate hydroxylase
MTTFGTREEVQIALDGWGPHIRDLVKLLPEDLPKWAIFDTAEHPASTYARGRLCIAGDAAHASSPLLGAGACMGVEDALVLSEALSTAFGGDTADTSTLQAISAALEAYSIARMERSQWLVQTSREAGDIYQWRHPVAGRDTAKCEKEFGTRARNVWDFDVDKMVTDAKRQCRNLIQADP